MPLYGTLDITQSPARLPTLPNLDTEAWALPKAETMQLLRHTDFQHLLEHYPRAKPYFIIAESVTDRVESGYLIRTCDGAAVRPEDYLQAFERFVRDNPEHVEAIQILLERPTGWSSGRIPKRMT